MVAEERNRITRAGAGAVGVVARLRATYPGAEYSGRDERAEEREKAKKTHGGS